MPFSSPSIKQDYTSGSILPNEIRRSKRISMIKLNYHEDGTAANRDQRASHRDL